MTRTEELLALAKECGLPAADIESLQEHQPEFLASFYTKAQAQALRDAADLVHDDYGCDVDSAATLRRIADELEAGK